MYQCNADSSGPCFMEHKTNWAESGSGLWTETPLYTPQPKSEWVGLTDEEVWETDDYKRAITDEETRWLYRFARAIEAALKEKNK